MKVVVLQENELPGLDLHNDQRMTRGAQEAENVRFDEAALQPLHGSGSEYTTADIRGMAWHI